MRRRRRLPIEELAPYLLPDVPRGAVAPAIDWSVLFGNDRPIEVEVGFGKGLFLLTSGSSRPEVNFFGVEIIRKYQLHTATRLVERKLPNVRVACADAKLLLRDRVPPGSVHAVHVYFPDPWWKSRHHKRRLFTSEFVAIVEKVLQVGGRFHIVTDVEEYFTVMLAIMKDMPAFAEMLAPPPTEPQHDFDYLTNFERKFRKEGRPIYRAVYIRR
ncbi:MAG: tRNA (guanosine(46)-N7)-methyltransferase TrmB [Planctomycetes bacterium]|nr:tRNA (guanosine(46)-N7)-methyltransferase TrmB [Planctomycetota bacterium]